MKSIGPQVIALSSLLLAGCLAPSREETAARERLARTGREWQPAALPAPAAGAGLAEHLRVALHRSPKVAAAWHRWRAAGERITVARSLPDPRLAFQADLQGALMSLMPGLMLDLPGPGKRAAAGVAAAAETERAHWDFVAATVETAAEVKAAWHRLGFQAEEIRLLRESLELLAETETVAVARSGAGRTGVADVLRLQMARARLANRLANRHDERTVLQRRLATALGLPPDQSPPPGPDRATPSPATAATGEAEAEQIQAAVAGNPRLRALAADVRQAEAELRQAALAGVPDFSLGVEADVKALPWLWRPRLAMTLPIWRAKIKAERAAARAGQAAAAADLAGGQLDVALAAAEQLFLLREAGRATALVESQLLPKARQVRELARASYTAGTTPLETLLDAQRELLELELEAVAAKTARELALADLSRLLAAPPPGAPSLSPSPTETTP
ncbi:MAG: TolC family protein [Lentisphaeria bacterium]